MHKKNFYISLFIYLAFIPLTIILGIVLFKDRKYNIISMIIAFLSCVPFFLRFEKGKQGVRELIVIAVMTGIAVIGRLIFAPIPAFKPVTAIVIIIGVAYGSEAGFITGAMSAMVSNIFFGQGPWTPFQMFAFGFIGLLAGVDFMKKENPSKLFLIILGIIGGVMFSLLMDIWSVLSLYSTFNFSMYVFYVAQSLPFMIIYVVSNIIFLLLLTNPILEKLNRIKCKYGVFNKTL